MICSEASSFFPFPISVSHSTKNARLQVMRICVRNKRSKCLLKQNAQTQTKTSKTAKIEQHSAFMCIPHPHRILTSISPSVDPKNHRVACIFAWMVLACAGTRKIQKAQVKHKTSQDITIFHGKTHYKWPCSIAMLNYQRVAMKRQLRTPLIFIG